MDTLLIPQFVKDVLACPACKHPVSVDGSRISCINCGAAYTEIHDGVLDLMPVDAQESEDEWRERQDSMELFYSSVMSDRSWAPYCFENDYGPFVKYLGTLAGSLLDVGGGLGVTRQYLTADTRYVNLDPSMLWLNPRWDSVNEYFPIRNTPSLFVRGAAECLPFKDASFDVVLAMWSLNHTSSPKKSVSEISRILKAGGLFFAVLEDVEPRFRDILRNGYRHREKRRRELLLDKAVVFLPGRSWPLQEDHIRITEREIGIWTSSEMRRTRRYWVGTYLCLEFVKSA